MNNFQVDLTNCDLEPIHIPDNIQSHGFLVGLNKTNLLIEYISENCTNYLPQSAAHYLNKTVEDIQSDLNISKEIISLYEMVKLSAIPKALSNINPLILNINQRDTNLIFSQSESHIILEFEPLISDLELDINKLIGKSISEILSEKTLSKMLQNTAEEIKKIINYDRVMVYRFDDEGHGEVISEVKNDDLEPFIGLHYPSTDIPRQARELYKINLTRIIVDVESDSIPILTSRIDKSSLNLTNSTLRAVSPIHIQYLKNMGVASSFSISLIVKGKLWGLIACHNYTPRFINYQAREAAKLIGQILSSGLEHIEEEENFEAKERLNNTLKVFTHNLENAPNIIDPLINNSISLLDITNSTGVVLIYEDKLYCKGDTPNGEQIIKLVKWLRQVMDGYVYKTHQLQKIYPDAKEFALKASGIMACILSKELNEYIIWFKPEELSTIHWAGNPDKISEKTEDGIMFLSPRKSFSKFSEIVKYNSSKWSEDEVKAVLSIREKIITLINKRANEIRILNEKLTTAYNELDTFSYTIAHDLRTPLSSIKSYTELLLMNNQSIDDKGKKILEKVVSGVDKMNFLIKEILNYSRVGKDDFTNELINMEGLIQEIKNELMLNSENPNLNIKIGKTPNIKGDKSMINQVFSNLIGNAVKYSSKSEFPEISIEGELKLDEIVYKVIDNGIGIDSNYHAKVFELFKRMDNVKDYEGTGVGLAIVKRILEKHDARIWFESELNVGTIFYITFKK